MESIAGGIRHSFSGPSTEPHIPEGGVPRSVSSPSAGQLKLHPSGSGYGTHLHVPGHRAVFKEELSINRRHSSGGLANDLDAKTE